MTARAFFAKRVVTCDALRATPANLLGAIDDGVVVIEGNAITFVGSAIDAPKGADRIGCEDFVVTPGLVDAHTHACWVGSRHGEYAVRMAGGDYRAIAQAGGGILSSHRAIVAASEAELVAALSARLTRMARMGVTTVEVKSGYGLLPEQEKKQLRAIAAAAKSPTAPHVVATFLALHALPESARVDRAGFVAHVARQLVPEVARERLARFVDAYVDENAFTIEEARAVCAPARALGLGVRLHVGQFADVRGAELCAELGALSADHLEHVSEAGARALAAAGTHAVLLPTASFTLGQSPPPIALLRAHGVPLVVASDANPGTAPTESLPLAIALAVRLYGLSPEEALIGATRLAAASLGIGDQRGALRVGMRADLVVWELPHEHALVQPWGTPQAREVLRDGVSLLI